MNEPKPAASHPAQSPPPPEASGGEPDGVLKLADIVQPERVRLREDAFHVLTLQVDGREFRAVRPVRVFPLSGKADYVSFLDEKGKETVLVAHPRGMDRESRQVLRRAIDRMYYVPKILRVDGIAESMAISRWKVLTDMGYASFEVVDRDYIRRLPDGRFMIEDADGNRFEIEDIGALDPRSRALVESET